MKYGKLAVTLLVVALIGIFAVQGSCYAWGNIITVLPGDAADKKPLGSNTNVVDAEFEGKKLSSGETLTFGLDMIDELTANAQNVTVNLNGANVKGIPGVTNPVAYMIGYASTGLAGSGVGKKDDTYDFTDSTITPLVFSERFATGQTQQFADVVTAMQPDQIAVIIAIDMTADDIKKAIRDKVDLGKVVIVQATTIDSQQAFTTLFDQYKEGFNLRDAQKNNSPVVIKALQGAV